MSVRLSQLAKCRRQAAYGALDTVPDETPYDPTEYWFRGKVYEAVAAERARAEFGAAFEGKPNIERQIVVPWPLGEGHADILVRSERKLIEVKSSTDDSDIPLNDGITQAQLYLHYSERADTAEVWYFDPKSGSFIPLRIPVEPLSDEQANIWVAELLNAQQGGALPGRVCSHPREGAHHLCPFVATCFADYAEPVEKLDDRELAALAASWQELKTAEKRHADTAADFHEQRREVEDDLRKRLPLGKSEVPGFAINRIEVGESYSLPLRKAISSGLWTDAHNEQFGQLISRRKSYERFDIKPTAEQQDAEPVAEEDEVPF